MPALPPELIDLLRCPETMQKLSLASRELLDRLFRDDAAARPEWLGTASMEAGLVREDGKVLYPIRDGIPLLMMEDAVAVPAQSAAELP